MSLILPIIYLAIPAYALFTMIGACTASLFLFFSSEKIHLQFKELILYMVVSAISGVIGSKVLFTIAMIASMSPVSFTQILYYLVNGGYVFYGGLFGVILGIVLVSFVRRRKPITVLNFASPSFALFHSISRLGCLFAGCCYGVPWSWGVILQGETIVRFPVQLVEAIFEFFVFVALLYRSKKAQSDNGNFAFYMVSYAIGRFVLEFFRGDTIRGMWVLNLSTSQIIALLVLIFFALQMIMKKHIKLLK